MASPPEIFDRRTWRLRRDRALPTFERHDFLFEHMAEEIAERLAMVQRPFARALDLGVGGGGMTGRLRARGIATVGCDPGFAAARRAGGVQCDPDRLPFADASFDLIVSVGMIDGVNDLPGALALARRILKPDGLFLAAFCGAGSLSTLKAALLAGDGARPAARVHPQIDVRSAGDLLARAGFALPVADVEPLSVRYGSPLGLIHDLRGMAATSRLKDRAPSLTRARLAGMAAHLAERCDADGRFTERFEIIHLSGWAPSPSQPRPARRGSGTVSLAQALGRKGSGGSQDMIS